MEYHWCQNIVLMLWTHNEHQNSVRSHITVHRAPVSLMHLFRLLYSRSVGVRLHWVHLFCGSGQPGYFLVGWSLLVWSQGCWGSGSDCPRLVQRPGAWAVLLRPPPPRSIAPLGRVAIGSMPGWLLNTHSLPGCTHTEWDRIDFQISAHGVSCIARGHARYNHIYTI